jgi:hypothetical protein
MSFHPAMESAAEATYLGAMDAETREAFARIDRWFELSQAQHAESRAEMRQQNEALRTELRGEMRAQGDELRAEMRDMRTELSDRIDALTAEFRGFRDWVVAEFVGASSGNSPRGWRRWSGGSRIGWGERAPPTTERSLDQATAGPGAPGRGKLVNRQPSETGLWWMPRCARQPTQLAQDLDPG